MKNNWHVNKSFLGGQKQPVGRIRKRLRSRRVLAGLGAAVLACFALAPGAFADDEVAWRQVRQPAAQILQLKGILTLMQQRQATGQRQGMTVVFAGHADTDKMTAARVLGTSLRLEVHRVDLSALVSTHVGETEKNLARVFQPAERQGWILFFDGADALFGKRTDIRDAHDRYSNQAVTSLLRRIEAYPGLVILASNLPDGLRAARAEWTVVFVPSR
jgi:SpoVK/Ycf46/Vps4 family AAA+-type ATPase